MKRLLLALMLSLSAAAHAAQGAEYVNSYFDLWLKAHDFHAYDKRAEGLYFPANGALLDGDINEVNELQAGKFYTVESRISLRFKDGRRLDDFVAGAGTTSNAAFEDSLQNFCMTTLHPIYAELFDHADPHVRKESWTIGGKPRRVFLAPWGQRGTPLDAAAQARVEQLLAGELRDEELSGQMHWVKLVLLIAKGKLRTLDITVDGVNDKRLQDQFAGFAWAIPANFTVSKFFFVIGQD